MQSFEKSSPFHILVIFNDLEIDNIFKVLERKENQTIFHKSVAGV